jgi:4-amino-4-deoxy-L-arabinose transferase-like glycosyltransferase
MSAPENGARLRTAVVALAAGVVVAVVLRWDSSALYMLADRLTNLLRAAQAALFVAGLALLLPLVLLPARCWVGLRPAEVLLLAFAGGTGLLSVVVFGVGASVGLTQAFGWLPEPAGLVPALLAGWTLARRTGLRPRDLWMPVTLGPAQAALALLICVVLALLGCLALTPPILYDVTEYHLGAWTDYLAAGGRFVPTPHNFYARFPFPVQSLYYLGLAAGDPLDFAPKILNAFYVAAGGGLIAAWLSRAQVGRAWRLLAVVAFLAHPVVFEVSFDAFIDAPSAFLVVAALYALLLAAGAANTNTAAHPALLPLAGLIAGTALASKYTAAQIYLLPVAVVVAGPVAGVVRRGRAWGWLAAGMALGAVPLAVWLGKNAYWYGNPLEPFFQGVFRRTDAAAVAREQFYLASHYPQPFWTGGYWQSLPHRLHHFGWLNLAPLAAAAAAWGRRPLGRLLVVIAGSYLLWNLVRESQNRFLIPSYMLTAVAGAFILDTLARHRCGRWPAAVAGAALAVSAVGDVAVAGLRTGRARVFDYAALFPAAETSRANTAPGTERAAFYRRNLHALGAMAVDVNTTLPANARILLVYEARPYLFARETVYNTVFDESELLRLAAGARSAEEVEQALRRAGISHVLVYRRELRRFIEQYARPLQLRKMGLSDRAEVVSRFAEIRDPEDYYPPFYRHPQWPHMRDAIIGFLSRMRQRATVVHDTPPVEIFLTPL